MHNFYHALQLNSPAMADMVVGRPHTKTWITTEFLHPLKPPSSALRSLYCSLRAPRLQRQPETSVRCEMHGLHGALLIGHLTVV